MGDPQHTTRLRRASAITGAVALLAALGGCAGATATAPAPTVTVTVTPEPVARAEGEADTSASYTCGRYSSLLSIGYTTAWHHDRGDLSDEAYESFLERQAFQLWAVQTRDTAVSRSASAVREHLQLAKEAAGRWTYDPAGEEWTAVYAGLSAQCAEAGSGLAAWAEPEMGG